MRRSSGTSFVVLGLLGLLEGKAASGYDIKRAIDGSVSHFWSESYGQIYPVLRQMTADKLVAGRKVKGDRRGKIVYTITAKGKKSLRAWMEKTPARGPMRDELILKIFFGSQTRIEVLIRHLQGYRDRLQGLDEQYSQWLMQAQKGKEKYTPFQVITLRGGIAMSEAFVRWADETLAALRQMKKRGDRGHAVKGIA